MSISEIAKPHTFELQSKASQRFPSMLKNTPRALALGRVFDILVIGKEKQLNLDQFEKIIGKEINLHIFSWSEWNKQAEQNKAFYFEIIIYGVPLHGEMPLVKWK